MANAIELAKSYVPKLDEVYKLAALTSVLDSDGVHHPQDEHGRPGCL